jgi:hypothetical protein
MVTLDEEDDGTASRSGLTTSPTDSLTSRYLPQLRGWIQGIGPLSRRVAAVCQPCTGTVRYAR